MLTSCMQTAQIGANGVDLSFDDDFDAAVSAAIHEPGTNPLSDFTDFEWQTVSVFIEGASSEAISQEVGVDVLHGRPYYHNSNRLLVFCKDGAVVALYAYGPPDLQWEPGRSTFSSEAVLREGEAVKSKMLTEPSGQDVKARCAPS